MDYISELTKQFANEILRHRRYNYSQETLYSFLQNNPEIICKPTKIQNKRDETLELTLFHNQAHSSSTTCIVYAHGLGSNKIEILPIVENMRTLSTSQMPCARYHICSFDFSGSGRSQGQHTTYGIQEQDDVLSVLAWLDSLRKYSSYILWGRSMGAVSIVLSQSQQLNPKVQCLVLDSPFSSFEKVAVELAHKKSIIPEFMLELLIQPLKKYISSNYPFNPFDIDTCGHIKNIGVSVLLMHSKNDNIVSHQHSKILKGHCKKPPFQIELTEDHNVQRSKETLLKIVDFIEGSMKANSRKQRITQSSKSRGISLTSKEKNRNPSRRGIFNSTQKLIRITPSSQNLQTESVEEDHLENMKQTLRKKLFPICKSKQFHEARKSICLNDCSVFLNSTSVRQTALFSTSMEISSFSEKENNMRKYNGVNHSTTQLTGSFENKASLQHIKKAMSIHSVCQNIGSDFHKALHAGKEARRVSISCLRKNRFR